MPPLTFLIKPASGSCNMRCKYCFYADETALRSVKSFGMMQMKIAEALIKLGLENADISCTFAFQGGEPTLSGLEFYRSFVQLVKLHNTRGLTVNYSIQTNAVLIDEEWAKFLAENKFLVGVSLDGPAEIHNPNRVLTDGSGSYNHVMKTVNLLKKHRVDFNILTVVTKQTARYTEKIYRFLQKNGMKYQQYIACLDPFAQERGQEKFSLTPKAYGDFLCKLFDLWYTDLKKGQQPYIQYFENLVAMSAGQAPELCGMSGRCAPQYVVEADGGVYPCDFYVMDDYIIGNVNENTLEEINAKCAEIGFIEKSLKPSSRCISCDFRALCRGGCRRDRDFGGGELGLNYFCEAYQKFFAYSYPRIREISTIMARNLGINNHNR